MSAPGDENGGRTRAVLVALLFVALGGAVLLRFGSESGPESVLDPQANTFAEHHLRGETAELEHFLAAPVGSRLDQMATAAGLARSSDAPADAARWRAAAERSSTLAVLGAGTTARNSTFVLVYLWRGQIGFMGQDAGPFYLGRACARVTVESAPDDRTRASVRSEKIDCPPEAPMPIRMDG